MYGSERHRCKGRVTRRKGLIKGPTEVNLLDDDLKRKSKRKRRQKFDGKFISSVGRGSLACADNEGGTSYYTFS